MYSWQAPEWPHYRYDRAAVLAAVAAYAQAAGTLQGQTMVMGQVDRSDAVVSLMVEEAITSSAIEGETLNREDVRSSILNYLGLHDPPKRVGDPRAEGIAALAVHNWKHFDTPLTREELGHWHSMIFSGETNPYADLNVGDYRVTTQPMQIVSGPIGYERVHYEAPPSATVPQMMETFIDWFNHTQPTPESGAQTLSGVERAALAHLWFETIHPYEDGNGRIGRAIAEKALSQDVGAPLLASLSQAILKDKSAYYEQLSNASRGLDIDAWMHWFIATATEAQKAAQNQVRHILAKTRFWDAHRHTDLNARQTKAINKMFDAEASGFEGGMTPKKYMGITRCSKATATRDLQDLMNKGCLSLYGGGRATRYELSIPPLSIAPGVSKE